MKDVMNQPGCTEKKEGRIQNSGGIGLQLAQSNTPRIYSNKAKVKIVRFSFRPIV